MRHPSLSLAPVLEAFQLCEDFCNITVQILTFLRKSLQTTKGLGKKYSGIEKVWSANKDFFSFVYLHFCLTNKIRLYRVLDILSKTTQDYYFTILNN